MASAFNAYCRVYRWQDEDWLAGPDEFKPFALVVCRRWRRRAGWRTGWCGFASRSATAAGAFFTEASDHRFDAEIVLQLEF